METDGRFDSGKCGEGLIFLITTGSIDTIEYIEKALEQAVSKAF